MILAKDKAFDPACFTLAESALPAGARYALKAALAMAIQESVEDWLANHDEQLKREIGPNWESEL
jgi:hypothetical protein